MAVKQGYQPNANPDMHRAMVGKRSSNAAGSHDERPNRQRTRATQRQAAIDSYR